jgi:hypothetical protein
MEPEVKLTLIAVPSGWRDVTMLLLAPSEELSMLSWAADASERPATLTMASAMAADLRPLVDLLMAGAVVAVAIPL